MGLDQFLFRAPRLGNLNIGELATLRDKLYEMSYFHRRLEKRESENIGLLNERVNKTKALVLTESSVPTELWEVISGPDSIFTEVAYWRKFNALHGWFVKNCQNGVDDCGYYEVTKEDLEKLLLVLEYVEQNRDPDPLLPVSGFFFGSTEISDWYWEDVKNTIPKIKEILETTDFQKNMLAYHSSW